MLLLSVDRLLAAVGAAAEAPLVEDCPSPIRLDAPETLRGPARTLEEKIFDIVDGRTLQRSVSSRFRYTEAGAMLEEALIRSGVTSRRAVYVYTSSTQALERVDEYGTDQRLQSIDLFSYDPGRQTIVRNHESPPGALRTRQIFTIGRVGSDSSDAEFKNVAANHRIVSTRILTDEGETIRKSSFRFTRLARLAGMETIRGSIREEKACSYDSSGRLIKATSRQDGPGEVLILREENYNYRPGMVEGKLCDGGSLRCSRLVLAGGVGEQQSITIWASDGGLQQRFIYDPQGQLIGIDSYDVPLIGSQCLRLRYTRDSQGNWIRKQAYCGPVDVEDRLLRLCEIVERNITYYRDVPLSSPPKWVNGIHLLGRNLVLPLAPTP